MDTTIPVTLIVKASNQQFEDQTIKCELSWTIRKLKGYLTEVYPSRPVSISAKPEKAIDRVSCKTTKLHHQTLKIDFYTFLRLFYQGHCNLNPFSIDFFLQISFVLDF